MTSVSLVNKVLFKDELKLKKGTQPTKTSAPCQKGKIIRFIRCDIPSSFIKIDHISIQNL